MKLSDFLFVREGICLFCKEEETYGEILCRDCRKQLEAHGGEYAYDEVHSCSITYFYNRFLQQIFRQFKYHDEAELAEPIGALLAAFVKQGDYQSYTHIVPVPMHPAAIKKRGYNHTHLMAEELSRRTGLVICDALLKTKNTRAQNKLNRAQRETNLLGAFQPAPGIHLTHANVLLLDDFVTTGNTMKHATRALTEAGPARIHGLAFTAPRFYRGSSIA